MEWLKGKRDNLNQIESVSVKNNKYEIKLSLKDFTSTEEGDDSDVQYLKVINIGNPSTYDLKQILINLQKEYDKSDEVNSFVIDGKKQDWLDITTRVGLLNSCNVLESIDKSEYKVWLGGKAYTLPISFIKNFLIELEVYAMKCYEITEQHLAEINALSSREEILAYDITKDYPPMIEIDSSKI